MTDTTRDLMVRGIAAAKTGDIQEAEFYLEWLLRLDPPLEEKKEAWFWLSEINTDTAKKRGYLEEILSNDLWDSRARRSLAILDGKLNPQEIIDPNQVAAPASPATAKRFTCPTCGGKMTYTPDGQSLTCEFCESRQRLSGKPASSSQPVAENDFIIGLATAKGHSHPVTVQEITCQGCGATFILHPQQMAASCPYCQSAYVVDRATSREIVSPDGLIPFLVREENARQRLRDWFAGQHFDARPKVARGLGIYLPVWVFDVGGVMSFKYEVEENRGWMTQSDQQVIQQREILVPAIRHLQDPFDSAITRFSLRDLVPYDERYLVNWLAETYQINMADASLNAREIALDRERTRIEASIETSYREIRFSSANMQIESYRLVLLPVWITRFSSGNQIYTLWINGQSGEIIVDPPR